MPTRLCQGMADEADISADTTGPTGGAEPAPSDADILAEITAGESGESTEQPAEPAADTAKPAEADDTKVDPPKGDGAEARARKILDTANRRLARANHQAREGREAIIRGLKTKPLETLRELGVPIGDILASGETEGEPAKPLTSEDRIAKLEAQLAERDAKADQERQQAQVDSEVAAVKAKITTDLKAAAKDFPLINRGEAFDLVTDTMVEFYNLHGKACTAVEAAATVEAYLQKLSGAAPSAPSNGTKPAQPRQGSVTLGNRDTRNVAPDGDDWPDDIDQRAALAAKELGLNPN